MRFILDWCLDFVCLSRFNTIPHILMDILGQINFRSYSASLTSERGDIGLRIRSYPCGSLRARSKWR